MNILKNKYFVILINHVTRDITGDNFTKNTLLRHS